MASALGAIASAAALTVIASSCQSPPEEARASNLAFHFLRSTPRAAPVHPNDLALVSIDEASSPLWALTGVVESVLVLERPEGGRRRTPLAGGVFDIDAVDLDGDGREELVLTEPGVGRIEIRAPTADLRAPLLARITATAAAVAAADIDGDGDADLLAIDQEGDRLLVWRHDGALGFSAAGVMPTDDSPADILAADLDGDGVVEIAVAAAVTGTIRVLRAVGDPPWPTAAEIDVPAWPLALASADLDGDGVLDLVASANLGDAIVTIDGATLTATGVHPTAAGPSGIAAADLDGDGDPDVAVAEKFAGTVSLWANHAGELTWAASFPVSAGPTPLLARDVSGDGAVDLITAAGFVDRVDLLLAAPR